MRSSGRRLLDSIGDFNVFRIPSLALFDLFFLRANGSPFHYFVKVGKRDSK